MSWERKDTMLTAMVLPLMVVIAAAGTCKVKKDQVETRAETAEHAKMRQDGGLSIPETVDELVSRGQVKMVFEEHAAAWLSHDNAFVHQPGESSKHRGGVVFQLADYRNFRIDSVLAGFSGVEIEGTAGSQTFERGEFFWIDIVSKDPKKTDDPIGLDEIGQLFLDPSVDAECIPLENCSGKDCLGRGLKKIPEQCVRQRQIDTRYRPEGLLTYWQGAQGYDVESRHSGRHTTFTFTFRDPVDITVYKNKAGRKLPLEVGTVAKIFIHLDHEIHHGEVHDPGFGGSLTKSKGG